MVKAPDEHPRADTEPTKWKSSTAAKPSRASEPPDFNEPLKNPMPLVFMLFIGPLAFVCMVEFLGLSQKIEEWVERFG